MNVLRPYLFLAATIGLVPASCAAWLMHSDLALANVVSPSKRISSLLLASDSGNSQNDDVDDDVLSNKRKMEMVRNLQDSFYNDNATRAEFDVSTGMIYNLPLWRVPWVELPGRSNCLNVHEPLYTNMFETILRHSTGSTGTTSTAPFYVGHLHLPGGTKNLKSPDPKYRLRSWDGVGVDRNNILSPREEAETDHDRSAVLGTLLRISDYRRMSDGRLLLLVQAVERFVVTQAQQELPYSTAHVQLLPDTEEVEDSDWITARPEGDVVTARALALAESFQRWHRYEFENTMLPLPLQADLQPDQVVGSALAKVLPYAPYSSVVDVEHLAKETLENTNLSPTTLSSSSLSSDQATTDDSLRTLEYRLLQGRILNQPSTPLGRLESLTCDQLEIRLWLALNDFLQHTRTPVSPVLFGLLPWKNDWPLSFVLKRIGDTIAAQTEKDHKYVRVSPHYPAARRQKRLAYAVAALLEDLDTVNDFRQELLEIPSTRMRLAMLVQKLENEGGFQ
jgi:Lon protease-like protein